MLLQRINFKFIKRSVKPQLQLKMSNANLSIGCVGIALSLVPIVHIVGLTCHSASGIRDIPTYHLYTPTDTRSPVPPVRRPERGKGRKGSGIVGRGGDEGGGWRHTRAHVWSTMWCIAQLSETLRNRSAGFGQPRDDSRASRRCRDFD